MASEVFEILSQVPQALTVKRVFGEAYEHDGAMVVPVAAVRGGGGGGGGSGPDDLSGSGTGYGLAARPVGVFVVRDGEATWHPAVDVNRVVLGGQLAVVALALVARSIVGAARRR